MLAAMVLLAAAFGARAQQMPGMGGFGGGAGFGAPAPGTGPGFLDLDAGLAYTDNARFGAANKTSDEIAMAGVDVNYIQPEGGMLDMRARGNVDWVQYLHHTFAGEPYGALNADAIWGRPTNMVQWLAHETFGESLANPLAAPTLGNLEYTNHITTGPSLNFNFGASDRLSVHALYSNSTFQRSSYGSNSYDGGAVFMHALSAATSVSINADATKTQFSNRTTAPTYETRSASAGYQTNLLRTELTARAGYTEQNYSGAYRGAPSFELRLSHQLSAFSSVYLNGQSGYSTLGQSMGANLGAPAGASVLAGMLPGTSSAAPFKNDLASVGWNFERARTGISLTASMGRQHYEALPPGYASVQTSTNFSRLTNKNYSATLSRQLRPSLSLTLSGFLSDRRVDNLDASTRETMFDLSLAKRFSRTGIKFYIRRIRQTASGAYSGLDAGTFAANMVGLAVTYDLVGQRVASGP